MRTFGNNILPLTGIFILLELILSIYQFIRLLKVPTERKRWWTFILLILLLLYNITIGALAHIAWTILVNFSIGMLYVAYILWQKLHSRPESEEKQLLRFQEEQLLERFLENCRKYNLTSREIDVALLLRKGHKNWQIATELFISKKTAESHIQHIYEKTGVRGRFAVVSLLHQLIPLK